MPSDNGAGKSLLEMVSLVAQRVQIEDIHMVRSTVRREFESDQPPPVVEFGFNAEANLDRATQRINARVIFSFDSYFEDDERPESPPLHIDVGFALAYSLQSLDDIDDEKIDAFGKMNAVYNAWPYVREFVQSTLLRMGLPALTLPVLTSGLLTGIYNKDKISADEAEESTIQSE